MTGYEAIARAAAAAGCHCWFTVEEDDLYTALCTAVEEGRCLQPETAEQAAYMAMGAAAAGVCPLLSAQDMDAELLMSMAQCQLPCVAVQRLPVGQAPELDAISVRVLMPTGAAEAGTLTREAFTIARSQKAPVLLLVSQEICEEQAGEASESAETPDLCKQMEQMMNSVGVKLDQMGKKLDEKLNSPEVVQKAESLKKQAGEVTAKAANGIARSAVVLADSLGKLVKSFVKEPDRKDGGGKDDDGNANG